MPWDVLDTLGAAATSYSDTTAAEGITYDYRVVAVNASGETISNTDQITTYEEETASPGSYALTGKLATFGLALTASAGAYAVTGKLATSGLTFSATRGTYTTTGTLATVGAAAPLTASPATYTLTGKLATDGVALPASASTYVVTGIAAGEIAPLAPLTATAGAYTTTGTLATFGGLALTANAGVYTTTGKLASVVAAAPLTATKGTLALTGALAITRAATHLTASLGSYTTTGATAGLTGGGTSLTVELRQGATLIATRTITPDVLDTFLETLTTGERDAITNWSTLRLAFIGTGDTIDVTWAQVRAPTNDIYAREASYVLMGAPAMFVLGTPITASPDLYAVTGSSAGLEVVETLSPGTYTATGADLTTATATPATAGVYIVTGVAATDVHASASQVSYVTAVSASTTSGTTISITIVPPAAAADLAIVAIGHRGGNTGTISAVTPGWTALAVQQNAGATVMATRLFSKVLTAGDIGVAHTFAFNTAAPVKGAIVAVVARGNGIALVTGANQSNAQQPGIPIPGIAFPAQGVLLVAVGHKANDQTHSLSGWTLDPLATAASAGGTVASRDRLSAHYRTFQGETPGGVTISAGGSGAYSTGHQLALAASVGLVVDDGLYALTANDAEFGAATLIPALVATYAQTGTAATTAIGVPVTATIYALTGAATTFAQTLVLSAAPGTVTITGAQATLESLGVFSVTAEPGAYASVGTLATVAAHAPLILTPPGAYISTGKPMTITLAGGAVTAGGYATTGVAAQFVIANAVSALRGTFTHTGAVLRHAVSTRMDPGTVAIGTPDAGLRAATFINATRGTVTLTGRAATVELGGSFGIPADRGVYTVTGQASGVAYAQFFSAAPGSAAIDGVANRLVLAVPMLAGAVTVSGVTATTTAPSLIASAGSVAVTGRLTTLTSAQFVSLTPPASYLLAGVASTEQVTRAPVLALKGTYTTTGSAATFVRDYSLIASAGAYALTGKLANDTVRHDLPALAGTYIITGTLAQLAAPGSFTINAERATVTISGSAATLFGTFNALSATAGAVTLTGASATLHATGLTLAAIRGTAVVTGSTAILDADTSLLGTSGSTTLTGATANLLTHSVLIATRGTCAIVGQLAGVSGDLDLSAMPDVYAVTAAALTMGPVLSATSGALVVTGAAAGLAVAQDFTAAPGAYVITGADASLIDITTPVLDIGRTEVVALTPNRTVVSLTPSRSVVELPTLVETE